MADAIRRYPLITKIDVIEKCCVDINSWMACNYMKLNTDKTEVLCIGRPANLKKVPIVRVNIESHENVASQHLENLGVIFDCNLNMKAHIRQISRNAFYHLHNICKVRQYLHPSVTEQLITMLVMSRIDYCNALLAGLPQSSIVPLQLIQTVLPEFLQARENLLTLLLCL